MTIAVGNNQLHHMKKGISCTVSERENKLIRGHPGYVSTPN